MIASSESGRSPALLVRAPQKPGRDWILVPAGPPGLNFASLLSTTIMENRKRKTQHYFFAASKLATCKAMRSYKDTSNRTGQERPPSTPDVYLPGRTYVRQVQLQHRAAQLWWQGPALHTALGTFYKWNVRKVKRRGTNLQFVWHRREMHHIVLLWYCSNRDRCRTKHVRQATAYRRDKRRLNCQTI